MAINSSTIWLFCSATSPYTRIQTTLNSGFVPVPDCFPFCTGGINIIGSGDLFYMDHSDSADPFSAYEKLLASPTNSGSHTSSTTCSEATSLLKQFITEPGAPNYTGELNGSWPLYFECMETVAGSGCPDLSKFIFARIYKRVPGEPLDIYLGETSMATPGSSQDFRTVWWNATGSINSDDRLVIKVYAFWREILILI